MCVCVCVCVCVCPRAVAFSRSRCHARARSLSLFFLECTRRTSSRRTLVISLARFKISHTHSRSFSCAHIVHPCFGCVRSLSLTHPCCLSSLDFVRARSFSRSLSPCARSLSLSLCSAPDDPLLLTHTHSTLLSRPPQSRYCLFVCWVNKTRRVKPLRRFHSWRLSFTQDGPAFITKTARRALQFQVRSALSTS